MASEDACSPATPVLSVRNLAISLPYGGDRLNAVQGISFDVLPGKIVCLLGESGSGKSVIANAVMGLLPPGLLPTTGSIRLQGRELIGAPQAELRKLRGPSMAMVFQEPMTALNPVVTCGEQIGEMLSQHVRMGRAARRRAILDIMRRVHLPDPERIYASYPHQLSGGQRQRIVIAIALILKPALLICDEPTTALDVTTQAEILELIRELQTQNDTAVLFITHDFGVVAEIADQVAVLELGHMIEQGDKHEVLTRPRQPYTRMLLDAVPELSWRKRPPLPEADPLLFARKVSKAYAAGSWPLEPAARSCPAGSFRVRAAAGDGRHCRRIGFGKVNPGSLHRPAHRTDFGRHRGERPLRRSPARAAIVTVSARGAGYFPGSISLAQSAPDRWVVDHRRADQFRRAARASLEPG